MTNAATEPTHRGLPRLAFFVLGAMFFGLAVADRLVALFAGFSSLVLIIFLAWLLAFLIVPLVDGLVRRLHLRRGIAVAIAYESVTASRDTPTMMTRAPQGPLPPGGRVARAPTPDGPSGLIREPAPYGPPQGPTPMSGSSDGLRSVPG